MKDWKKIAVSPDTSILKTIEKIDAAGKQLVLVVDEEDRLLGIVTDGDIRRGIMQGKSLESNVDAVMNANPDTAKHTDSIADIKKLSARHFRRQIPVVDDQNRVIGVEFDPMLSLEKKENWVVLMAGGLGNRLKPLTDNCPKPLLSVGDKPLLETIIERLQHSGIEKIFISVNYKAEMIKDYFGDGSRHNVEIDYLHEDQQLGTAGSLSLLPKLPKHPILVMNADLLTNVNFDNFLEFHEKNNSCATMGVREYDFQVPYGVVSTNSERITSIDEKPIHKFFVNAGMYLLNPEVLAMISKNTRIDMPDLFQKLIKQDMNVTAFPIREYWLDVGRNNDFERANNEYNIVFKKSQITNFLKTILNLKLPITAASKLTCC